MSCIKGLNTKQTHEISYLNINGSLKLVWQHPKTKPKANVTRAASQQADVTQTVCLMLFTKDVIDSEE